MWTSTSKLSKIVPAYTNTSVSKTDFVDKHVRINHTLTELGTPYYIYKVISIPKHASNFFSDINCNIRIHSIYDTEEYTDSSIDSLSLSKQYLTELNFYNTDYLNTLYIFKPITSIDDIYIEVEYELSNLTSMVDIYPFIATDSIVTSLQLKSSSQNSYQEVTKAFLLEYVPDYLTHVKVRLKYKLIANDGSQTYIFSSRLQITKSNVYIHSHTLPNWYSIETVTSLYGEQFYPNYTFDNLNKTGFIINSQYLYQVNEN